MTNQSLTSNGVSDSGAGAGVIRFLSLVTTVYLTLPQYYDMGMNRIESKNISINQN